MKKKKKETTDWDWLRPGSVIQARAVICVKGVEWGVMEWNRERLEPWGPKRKLL